ncbi:bifunctional folylpolyglutamate synthase/dihydrofolate synthase [Silvibacterium acidisoli]|uniref:bifunctional folylpolyglutamate synthase/dihydrofolate synthase n=1 Tax=Acidobacteriaceae bacterium ZG23-2 TaxID=2883246 RepID=UPI00406CF5E0
MSYAAAIQELFSLAGELHAPAGKPRRKFDLGQMRTLTEGLGHPERMFPSVLVAGTNGKGSTSATLASILSHAGYRVGLYTSPHLSRVNERIQFLNAGGAPTLISDDDFAACYFRVDDCARKLVSEGKLEAFPSFFEAMTALAFVAFAEQQVDIAVLEVGMGGRLDATNIVEPLVSVITDISLDHTDWLGDTITAIAGEKAGILRPDGVLVTLPQHPEANQAIGEAAVSKNVRGINAADYLPGRDGAAADGSYRIKAMGEEIEVRSPLSGSHQQRNIALAIATAIELSNRNGYKLKPSQISMGIAGTKWPGRLERFVREDRADVLIDVAHNPAGAWALRSALSHLDPEPKSMTLVFGCLRDKAVAEIAQILFPLFNKVVLTEVESPRRASMAEMQEAAAATGADTSEASDVADALKQAWESTPSGGLVVATGSVYLIGAVRDSLAGASA